MIVTDKAVEDALLELALLDDREAELRAAKEYGDEQKKIIFSQYFLEAEGTVAERDAKARTNTEYLKQVEDNKTVTKNHQSAKNKRDRLTMLVEIYRTESANRRQRT